MKKLLTLYSGVQLTDVLSFVYENVAQNLAGPPLAVVCSEAIL